jgi:hypothetical protein
MIIAVGLHRWNEVEEGAGIIVIFTAIWLVSSFRKLRKLFKRERIEGGSRIGLRAK